MKIFLLALLFFIGNQSIAQTSLQAKSLNNSIQSRKQNNLPDKAEANWLANAQNYLSESEYYFKKLPDNIFATINRAQRIGFFIDANKLTVKPIQLNSTSSKDQLWNSELELTQISKSSDVNRIPASTSVETKQKYLKYNSDAYTIEYANDKKGLRQNFIINKKPFGEQHLKVSLKITGSLVPKLSDKNTLEFTNEQLHKTVLIYDNLTVWDANKVPLKAYMELKDKTTLQLIVEDQNATYPITVDPLSHAPEWTASADAVLPGLLNTFQLQVNALLGYSVEGVGDVNGDGFDDVAIGAPGAIDIIAGTLTIVQAGAVFVYFGSASGLSTTPDKILRATTPVTNALFGFSIAGGNITGDNKNDIVVGAPGESYTATVGGFPSTATITAGKVYIFGGEDLAAAGNPSPLLSIFLDGPGFFTNGIGGNVSVNALFGFAVGISEDLNGDGIGDVIIGSPGYAAAQPILVRSGAAFVYYSSNLVSNTPTQLTAPAAGLLGVANLDGLLFGFSVDGLGDYNKDGKPDIVVGAPAGVNILTNFLGGSAYIYNGNGAGINTSFGTQITAAVGPLLGTVANLFGYKVRGVRDASGVRNGNILVGAPAGNVFTGLGGLLLKTGSLHVFLSTATPGANQIPGQSFSSPREGNLFSILNGQNLNVDALFGASIDNMLDVNCDGINDIIIGEPLSTGVGLIGANVVGGAAYVFLGKADGTYIVPPYWTLEYQTSLGFGINAASLLGYSVAGARHIRGPLQGVRALVGAPGQALDFSSGIFQLGNTFGTLYNFLAINDDLGKAFAFGFADCGILLNPDVNVTLVNVPVSGNVSTNDVIPTGTTYGTPFPAVGNPAGGTITMLADGTYTFSAPTTGVYIYRVPVCIPGMVAPCPTVELKITVLDNSVTTNPPVANTDITTTLTGNPVIVSILSNDKCSNPGCSLNTGSVTVTIPPVNGIFTVNAGGTVTYTSNAGFTGIDSLTYLVCDNSTPIALCATAKVYITVYPATSANTTTAADDYVLTTPAVAVSGNVKTNDFDAEGNTQSVTSQNITAPQGTLVLNSDGTFTFTPAIGFTGPIDFVYTTCDNGTPMVCANATLHILVTPLAALPVTLTDFKGVVNNKQVVLTWKTSAEINSSHFDVQNSTDGINFETIGTIPSHGTSSVVNSYMLIDKTPAPGINYYRLKTVDVDDKFAYSSVIIIKIGINANSYITVNPNPTHGAIRLNFNGLEKGVYKIILINSIGQIQLSDQITISQNSEQRILKTQPQLAKGIYMLHIYNGIQRISSIKVLIN